MSVLHINTLWLWQYHFQRSVNPLKSSSQKTFASPCLVSELCVREKVGGREERMEERERMHFIEPYFAEVIFETIRLVSHSSALGVTSYTI